MCVHTLRGHTSPVRCLAYAFDMDLALSGAREELAAYARKAWEGYCAALSTYDPTHFRDGINWNDVWGDGEG